MSSFSHSSIGQAELLRRIFAGMKQPQAVHMFVRLFLTSQLLQISVRDLTTVVSQILKKFRIQDNIITPHMGKQSTALDVH